jgi:hypothetical protein
MNWLKNMGSPRLRDITIAILVEMGLEWRLWNGVGGIVGRGLYVYFSVLTTKQTLGVT